ncbi:MAG: T9SS type B sorting domain-containing protein, partial [Bacteroidales bacterium]
CYANAGANISTCGLTTTLNAIEQPTDINTHWNPVSGITFSNINSPNSQITASTPGVYNLVWTITNSNGLTCSDTVTVDFKAVPTANFTITPSICQGQNATATYTGTGGNQFVWQFNGGNPNTAFSQGPHTISYNTAGTYNASLFVTGSNGCVSDTVTHQVVVNPLPPSTFTASSPICITDASTVQFTGGNGPYSYSWNWGTGTATPGTGPGPHQVTWTSTGVQTISLQVTNTTTGCVSTITSQQVQVLDASTPNCCVTPSPNAGPDASVCGLTYTMGGSMPAPGNIATWSTLNAPAGATVTFANQTLYNTAVTVSMPGSYTFEWHEVSGACDSSDVVVINFTAQPVANAGNKDQICGLDYTLNAIPSVSGSTGTWSVVAPMSATFSDVHSPTATAHGTTGYGTYHFVWTEQNGNCVSRDTVQVELLIVPTPNAGVDISGCGQYAHLNADNTYPGYWTSSTNLIYTPNSADPQATIWLPNFPQNQSYYQVTLTWHAFNGICGGTDDVVVTFVRPPKTEAGPTQSVCGRQTQLNADTIGSGIVSAYWTCNVPGMIINQSGNIPFNATVDASAIPNFYINSERPVYFYWHATNGPGCSDVDSVLVTFYEIPTANAGIDTAICGLNYTNMGTWSIDNHSGIWSSPLTNPGSATFTPNNTPTANVSVTQFGIYEFIWKEMNAGNSSCYSTDTITINFKVTPMPDAGLDFAVCGKYAQLNAHPTVPGGQWSGPPGVAYYIINASDTIYAPSESSNPNAWIRWPSENDTITMYWTEFNGTCYGYDSVNVYFGAIIDAIIQTSPSDSLVCGPRYTLLSAVPPSYGYGYWIDDVQNTTFTPSPTSPNNLVATIDTGGTSYYGVHNFYWITVNGDCRDTSNAHYVWFIRQPVANAGGNYWPGLFGNNHQIKTDTVCGLNYQMGAIPSVGTGTWYSNDITYVYFTHGFNNFTSTHVPNDSLYITSPTAYSVFSSTQPYREFIWQEENDICRDADTLRLYFAPRPSGEFTTTIPACRHDSSTIIAHTWSLPNNVDYGITSFEWTYPGGILSSVISDPTTSDTIYVSWPTGNTHTVSLIATNKWGCRSGIVSKQVIEPPMFDPKDSVVAATCGNCNGEIHLFTSYNNHPNYYTFNWLDSVITSTSYVQDSLCPNRYYRVRVNGQSLSPDAAPGTYCHDTIRIWLPDTGYVYARFDTMSIMQMQAAPYELQLINTTINGRKYSWRVYDDSGNLIWSSTLQDFHYTFEDEGCYRIVLIATSKQGCRDTVEYKWLCVDSKPEFDVPNVFTPNGDGQNDDFIIHGKAIVEFKCTIFNRWGKKLYEWDDITKGWNGKINGNGADASPGIYYYVVTAKDKKGKDYEQKGYFYLLKEKK